MDAASIYDGTAHHILSCQPYDGCAFPFARKLLLNLVVDGTTDDNLANSPETSANIAAFAQRIKQISPELSYIHVVSERRSSRGVGFNTNYNRLATQMIQLSANIEYSEFCGSRVSVTLQLDVVTYLACIMCNSELNSGQFALLARLNANTLQILEPRSQRFSDIASLIRNVDGVYASYPQLHTLQLNDVLCDDFNTERPRFEGVIPFPSLKILRIMDCYPFGDDTPFRGNADTLELLTTSWDVTAASVIINHGVFSLTSHPKLKFVSVCHRSRVVPDAFATTAEALQFALNIGAQAPVREIRRAKSGPELAFAFSLLGDYACIRVLILPYACLDVLGVIAMVKSLPLLSDLHSTFPNVGLLPTGVSLDEFPAYVIRTNVMVGERFRCWNFENNTPKSYEDAAKCILLLALVCQNYSCTVSPRSVREELGSALRDSIFSDMFRSFERQLQHFLF
ncbi:hypothetical protein GGI21_002052 [Coemansia aciculifera]|nr:hypothetical protein GGI21_002052 [Coemansia aciculifera]